MNTSGSEPAHRTSGRLAIRPAVAGDLDVTARLHDYALSAGFFPRLGVRFLRTYHRTFLASPHGVALVAVVDSEVVGMVLGSAARRQHTRWVRRHAAGRLALVGAQALALRPRLWRTFAVTRLRRYLSALLGGVVARNAGRLAEAGGDLAVLDHIAAADHMRRMGVGTALLTAFEHTVTAAGATEAALVARDNDPGVGQFYEAGGWRRHTSHTDRDGCDVVEYRWRVDARHAAAVDPPVVRGLVR